MAQHMDTHTRWEKADGRLHREDEMPATQARQGRMGRRVLRVLIAALVLAFIVWVPVEIWGNHQERQVTPQSLTTPTTSQNNAPETPAEVDVQHR